MAICHNIIAEQARVGAKIQERRLEALSFLRAELNSF